MNDNQYITKTDLRVFGKELTKELTSNIVNELDQRFDKKFEVIKIELKKDMDETAAHYYGLIREDFDHKFGLMREYLVDIPEVVRELREKAEQNEDEHRDFRVRIGALERV